ncbi:MAG: hypothetical protein QM504_10995 [Pseudomonadota bacterium]
MKGVLTKNIKTTFLTKELDENEKLVEYLLNGGESVKLTVSEKARMDRYFFCHDLISQKRSRHEVARKLKAKYGISRAQAYRDIHHMQYVIGSSVSIDANYYEQFLLDTIIETIRMAKAKGDMKAKAAAERNLLVALGYPKADDNRITPDMLAQHILNVTTDPTVLGKLKNYTDAEVEKMYRLFKTKKKKAVEFDDAEIVDNE